MKVVNGIISLASLVLLIVWTRKIQAYFFECTSADQFALLAILLTTTFLALKIREKIRINPYILAVFSFLLPFSLYPIIDFLLPVSDWAWLVIYVFLVLSSVETVCLSGSKTSIVPLVGYIVVFFVPYRFDEAQLKFHDRVAQSFETRKGHAQIVQWKDDYWLYYNAQLQYATIDKHIFQEAYVQPIMQCLKNTRNILLIGGDNRMIEDELTKFDSIDSLTILPVDRAFYSEMGNNEFIMSRNFARKNVIENQDFFEALSNNQNTFDAIILDVPDPKNVEYSQYYTLEFYQLCSDALKENALMVTQAGDIFKSGNTVCSILKTFQEVGLNTFQYQCQIPTIGQWTWAIGAKEMTHLEMRSKLENIEERETQWWNQEAMHLMMNFGKNACYRGLSDRKE